MKKVIIVGGGIAGISAGRHLVENGKFDVVLLEASSRIGGRVHTKPLGDHFIENGAQWVHGEDGNQIFKLANSYKLLQTEAEDDPEKIKFSADTVFVTNKGRILDRGDSQMMSKITHVIKEILEGPEDNEVTGSVGDWARETFKKNVEGFLDPNFKPLNEALLDWIHRFECDIDGSDNWFQNSLRGLHEYYECEGNPTVAWKSPACYASLFNVILNQAPIFAPTFQPDLPNWIELEKIVTKVDTLNADSVTVECEDGSTYHADHLICTVSLGVLKNFHKTLFHPSLPERKVLTIENLGIGCVDKLHFDFKTKWWPSNVYGFNLLWEDVEEVGDYWRSDIDETSLRKEIDGLPFWTRHILGFYEVPSHPTALNSWIMGPAAILVEGMTDDEVNQTFMKVLRLFLKPSYDIPDPVEFCRSSWGTNRFTMGSYSFRQMNSEMKNVWAADLAVPILNKSNVPIICFAGEATHDHYYSTVHGAYESGIREADRLINLKSDNK